MGRASLWPKRQGTARIRNWSRRQELKADLGDTPSPPLRIFQPVGKIKADPWRSAEVYYKFLRCNVLRNTYFRYKGTYFSGSDVFLRSSQRCIISMKKSAPSSVLIIRLNSSHMIWSSWLSCLLCRVFRSCDFMRFTSFLWRILNPRYKQVRTEPKKKHIKWLRKELSISAKRMTSFIASGAVFHVIFSFRQT